MVTDTERQQKCLEYHRLIGEDLKTVRGVLLTGFDDAEGQALLYEKLDHVRYLVEEILAETLPL